MITKKEEARIEVVTLLIYWSCREHCDHERFERIFNITFNLYRQWEHAITKLVQNPLMPTKKLISLYWYVDLAKDWQDLILSSLETRKSDKIALKYLSMSKEERNQYYNIITKETLLSKVKSFYRQSLYNFADSRLGIMISRRLYQKCKTFDEKVSVDATWKTDYLDDDSLTTKEKQEILDSCIDFLENIYLDYERFSASQQFQSAKILQNTLELLIGIQGCFARVLNGLVFCHPFVQPHHVKLLYNTFPPNSFTIEYSIRGLAYFGKTDLECRRLAYEGLEKFLSVILRQITIEEMKEWYGDFPRDLYEKYTTEYNELMGENLTY